MCGYWDDTNPGIGKEESENQVNAFRGEFPKGEVVKIFTSGSCFDPIEIDAGLLLHFGEILPLLLTFTLLMKLSISYRTSILSASPEVSIRFK